MKARFPTYQELVDSKLILPQEVARLEKVDTKTPHESTFMPILWAVKLLQRARTEGKVNIEPPVYASLMNSIDYVEVCNRKILNYGWINFPLAYTQVATVSVMTYFLAALFGRQYLIPRDENLDTDSFPHTNITYSSSAPFADHTPDFGFPFFTVVEMLSYLGWIGVAENLLNPFGDDDEDFQVNYMIDRNIQVSYLIVDEAEEEMDYPEDPFLEAGIEIPMDLPAYENKSSKALGSTSGSLSLSFINGDALKIPTKMAMSGVSKIRDTLRFRKDSSDDANELGGSNFKDDNHLDSIDEQEDTLYLSNNNSRHSVSVIKEKSEKHPKVNKAWTKS